LQFFSGLTGIAYDVVWLNDPVGEISFLTKGTATAIVAARTAMVFFAFDESSLRELLDKSEELNIAFSAMCNANLANKLVRTTEGTIG
jgi:CRP-like cAMP-binding protein